MKNLVLILLISLVGCASRYSDVLKPLARCVDDCRCRYEQLARDHFDERYEQLLEEGVCKEEAKAIASLYANRMVGRAQIAVARGAMFHCDCIKERPAYATN